MAKSLDVDDLCEICMYSGSNSFGHCDPTDESLGAISYSDGKVIDCEHFRELKAEPTAGPDEEE